MRIRAVAEIRSRAICSTPVWAALTTALVFDIVHHLSGEQVIALLRRVRETLETGATIAVLDMFRSRARRQCASAAALGPFFHLTSGADLHSPQELAGYLLEAVFSAPRRTRSRRIPDQALYQSTAI